MNIMVVDARKYLVSKEADLVDSIKNLKALVEGTQKIDLDGKNIKERIRAGRVFICYKDKKSYIFLPSRTVGYCYNLWEKRDRIRYLHGGDTNQRISKILEDPYVQDENLDRQFKKFCAQLGVEPYGIEDRKFWSPITIVGDKIVQVTARAQFVNSEVGKPSRDEKSDLRSNLKRTHEIERNLKRLSELKQEEIVEVVRRIFQPTLRNNVLKARKNCQITGIETKELLVASHIKPWRDCSDNEKLDLDNVLLLSATYDKLFDRGLISFDNAGKIIISDELSESDRKKLGLTKSIRLNSNMTEKMKSYMKWHREKCFKRAN